MPNPNSIDCTLAYTIPTFTGVLNSVVVAVASNVVATNNNAGLPHPPPSVSKSGTAGVQLSGQGAVKMQMSISDGSSNTFYLIGIAFQRTDTIVKGGGQTLVVTAQGSDPTKLNLTDTDSGASTYDFVILFQDSNGYFGVLDPKIMNT